MRTHRETHTARTARPDRSTKDAGMRGFAMMDVAFGAALLGIIVLGTLQIFEFGQQQISRRLQERSAYDMARTRMEEIVADTYAHAVSRVDSGLVLSGNIPATRTTTVTMIDDAADGLGAADADGQGDFKEVQVDVAYGPNDNTKTVALSSVLVP